MSFVEHLIENALVAISEAKDDKYQAFVNAMSALYNQQMLKEVRITEDELWEIAQYVIFVWEQDAPTADVVEVVRCEECRFSETCSRTIELIPRQVQNGKLRAVVHYCEYGERRDNNAAD